MIFMSVTTWTDHYPERMTSEYAIIDPQLEALIVAAEAGQPCPQIRLLSGGWLVQGEPVSTQAYLDTTAEDFAETIRDSKDLRRFRGSSEELKGLVFGQVNVRMAPFRAPGSGSPSVLSLKNAVLINSVTLRVPAIRVPSVSVQAWWNSSMEVEESKRYGSVVGVGMSF